MFSKIKLPILLVLAIVIVLAMLRLGVWQLDRAEQKTELLNQVKAYSRLPAAELKSLLGELDAAMRFRKVVATGRYLAEKSIYIDNQVLAGQVGYRVFTPFLISESSASINTNNVIMIDRGWISVGESRAQLPAFISSAETITLAGRLNTPPAKPPIWNDKYSVSDGQLWQYLPLQEYAKQMQLTVLPLVLELAPELTDSELGSQLEPRPDPQFKRMWLEIDDEWVAKHQGYAFQWFAMALAFCIACLVLLIRRKAIVKK